jgi:peptide-methionine (S)-S-oxide reductase
MKQLLVWTVLPALVTLVLPLDTIAAPASPKNSEKAKAADKPASAASTQSAKQVVSAKPTTPASSTGGAAETPAAPTNGQKYERAIFGMGCFWKTQFVFSKVPGVVRTRVGYTGGKSAKPTYEQVCSHTTGHAEVAEVEYDPRKVTYEKLLEVFFASHDPTTLNRQGPDFGDQYRSAIFYTSAKQLDEAIKYKKHLSDARKFRSAIVTDIKPAAPFYAAEDYHQDYFKKHGEVCSYTERLK